MNIRDLHAILTRYQKELRYIVVDSIGIGLLVRDHATLLYIFLYSTYGVVDRQIARVWSHVSHFARVSVNFIHLSDCNGGVLPQIRPGE